MPYGMSFGQYYGLMVLTLGSMLAGGTCVHLYFKPDLTIPNEAPPKPTSVLQKPTVRIVPPRGQRSDDSHE
eukprot:m.323389 g.323389  ORF g.323389 m.323389 type:complete len:71 (-) comp29095_c0_seq1:192-404(-)